MTIHLYTITWNEMAMLAFFFRHYESWVDRFVVYDDGSTDGTLDYLRGKPNVELRSFPRPHPDSFVVSQQALQNQCWKESRGQADWVIVTAIDEHLHHPEMLAYLTGCKTRGVTYVPALGYHMLTDEFPETHEHLARTRTIGASDGGYNKLRIFNPDAIRETSFSLGGHTATVEGRCIPPSRDEMLLLHYKDLGVAYTRARNSSLGERLGAYDRARNFGFQYFYSSDEYQRLLAERRSFAVDLSDAAYWPWDDNPEPRWWRPPDMARALQSERDATATLRQRVEQLEAQIAESWHALDRERDVTATLRLKVEQLEAQIAESAHALDHEREASASLRQTTERHETDIAELNRHGAELRELVERMTRSRSWRYTAPLRGLLTWVKGKQPT
jgi:cell division protein FtsB